MTDPDPDADALPTDEPSRRPRIAFLSYSSGEYDARTLRMARSAIDAGFEVTVYARWQGGLPPIEERDGYRIVRAAWDWRLAVPGLRGPSRRRSDARMAQAAAAAAARRTSASGAAIEGQADVGVVTLTAGQRMRRTLIRPVDRWWRLFKMFPIRPMGWAASLSAVAQPADIWHGMWAGSLPALQRLRHEHGGRTIYDSRDVYMLSRDFARLHWPLRPLLAALERRWARSMDRVLTVNDPYADLLVGQLGVARPPVVMNCPARWQPPSPPPDRIRAALGLPASTAIVLYQGQLMSERGIEQSMRAILEVPGAVLVLLGFGTWLARLTEEIARPPDRGRVFLLPAVPPHELLAWTASADVSVMAIQPTTVNHRFTTPQKLFESLAAGVPVVASDLPGMADVVRASAVGALCDPTSPSAIAEAIRSMVAVRPDRRAAMRAHVLDVGHDRYNWEAQVLTLVALYRELLPPALREAVTAPD